MQLLYLLKMEPEHTEGEESFVMPEVNYKPVHNRVRATAMHQLKNIVSTSILGQDIKRVRKAESVRGANEWAAKHSNSRRQYKVEEEDLDNDGIQDVLVYDTDGNLVIVNGYTIRKSDYPYRRMFGDLPEAVRKEHGNYRNYLKTIYGPTYDDRTGEITKWKQDPKQDERYRRLVERDFKTYIPRDRSPYQVFTDQVVKPLVHNILTAEPEIFSYQVYNTNGEVTTKYPPVLIAVTADAWNYAVIKPIIEHMTNERIPDNITSDALKALFNREDIVKFKKSKEFRRRVKLLVGSYVNMDKSVEDLIEKVMNRIGDTTDRYARKWLSEHKGVVRDGQSRSWMHAGDAMMNA